MAAFAGLWRACASIGLFPRVADDMEVWEVAAALGVGYRVERASASASRDTDRLAVNRALQAQRLAAIQAAERGERPPEMPAPFAADSGDVSRMMGMLGGMRG